MPGANNNMTYNVSHEIEGNEVVEGGEVGACGLYSCVCGIKKKFECQYHVWFALGYVTGSVKMY